MNVNKHSSKFRPSVLFGTPARFAAAGLTALLLLATLSLLSGCKSSKPATPSAPVQGTMNPDGTFTPAATQPAQQGRTPVGRNLWARCRGAATHSELPRTVICSRSRGPSTSCRAGLSDRSGRHTRYRDDHPDA